MEVELGNTRTASQHNESNLGKKQLRAKISIAFLFSQLQNKVTSDTLFHGGHLVMHSKRCAVQNQRITLRFLLINKYDSQQVALCLR